MTLIRIGPVRSIAFRNEGVDTQENRLTADAKTTYSGELFSLSGAVDNMSLDTSAKQFS